MAPQDDGLSLRFDLARNSPFFFKCQKCRVCCSNKTIRVGPYEILRLSRNQRMTTGEFLGAFVEEKSLSLRLKPDGECVFLSSQGCRTHRDRPLVCRLYPLGQLWDAEGQERFSNMPPHPDCLGYLSEEGTVEGYLESQDVGPYFYYEQKYSEIFRRTAEKQAGFDTSNHLPSPLVDVDATVGDYCAKRGIRSPEKVEEIIDTHIRALSNLP